MSDQRLLFRKIDVFFLLIYSSFIFYLSTRTDPSPLFIQRFLIPHLDKVFHTAEYGLLGYLWSRALFRAGLSGQAWGAPGYAFLICMLYAFMDEYIQSYVPGRISSAADLMADGTGAALAIGIGQAMRRKPFSFVSEQASAAEN
jgi:VanZ family protein